MIATNYNSLSPALYPEDFLIRLQKNLPKDFLWGNLIFTEIGLVVAKTPKGYLPLGCKTCFCAPRGQTSLGDPTISGLTALRGEDHAPQSVIGLSPEVIANLWLCPTCKMPLTSFLPKFS